MASRPSAAPDSPAEPSSTPCSSRRSRSSSTLREDKLCTQRSSHCGNFQVRCLSYESPRLYPPFSSEEPTSWPRGSPTCKVVFNLLVGWPSECSELTQLSKGSHCSVSVEGNPLPFAVGELLLTVEEVVAKGGSGKLLGIVHIFGDALHSRVAPSPAVPNEGFTPALILPISPTLSDPKEVEESSERSSEGQSMDELVLRSTLLCLRYVIREHHLPLLVSTLWSMIQRYFQAVRCES